MKKSIYFILALLVLFTACNDEKESFTLKGKIQGLESDTLLVLYQVPEYKLDTIFAVNGNFEYTFTPDTFTVLSLKLQTGETLPIYAEKGQTVELNGEINNLSIKGKGENKLLAQIIQHLKEYPTTNIKHKVDSIIRKNNNSFTAIYLIDKYFVTDHMPENNKLQELINTLNGIIKDTPYITELQKKLTLQNTLGKNKTIYALNNKDRKGENIKWHTIRNKYILINFWASWHPKSVAVQDSLHSIIKEFKDEDFIIVSISLDYDKEAWLKACSNPDATQWIQLCDFKGWQNSTVKNQGIHSLPSNILLDTNKQIITRDIRCDALEQKMKRLLKNKKKK